MKGEIKMWLLIIILFFGSYLVFSKSKNDLGFAIMSYIILIPILAFFLNV
jgi:hypothetical protein